MDDSPAIVYHPFGTITLNFDDVSIKLRRVRLGDLEFAKNLLEELRLAAEPQREELVNELNRLRAEADENKPDADAAPQFRQLGSIVDRLGVMRQDIFYDWLSKVIERMGDNPAPPKDEWPLELFMTYPLEDQLRAGQTIAVNEILEHWQTRPLAYGKPSQKQNGVVEEINSSRLSPVEASSPPAPQSP